jgi:protein involved in polysaccharide export with SLBB domain
MCLMGAASAQSLFDSSQLQQGQSPDASGTSQAPRSVSIPGDSAPGVPSTPSIVNSPNSQQGYRSSDNNNSSNGNTQNSTPQPPPPPTEFQRFVWGTSGRLVPLFGQNLFADAVQTYAPVDRVPVPADYVIGPGDELRIRAWGAVDVDFTAQVDRNGMINIPRVGSFGMAGIKASESEAYLRGQIGRIFKNFELNVTLGQLRSVQIFVVGQAMRPGSYTVSSLSTLVTALFASGGPNPNGSMRHIVLRRGDKVVTDLDLYDFLVNGSKRKDARLLPGDVIMIPPAGPRVAVLGAVKASAIYELSSPTETLGQVLAYGGGTSVVTSTTKAQLERIDPANPNAPRQVSTVTLDAAGLSLPLRDADILTAFEVRPVFSNAITLRGNVEQPLRYPFQPGMRISTLIPERSALVTRDYYRRQNRLVEFLQPGDSGASWGSGVGAGSSVSSSSYGGQGYGGNSSNNAGGGSGPNGNPGAAAIAAGLAGLGGGGLGAGAVNSALNVGSGGNGGNSTAGSNSFGQGGNSGQGTNGNGSGSGSDSTRPPGSGDGWASGTSQEAAQRQRSDRLPDPDRLLDQVNWDYAAIERLDPQTLSIQLIPFNLRRAVVDHDPANDIELKPGDVVTIFSLRDVRGPMARQTQFVRVEGEVQSPGVYQLLPGETLRQVLQRVGGLTNQAYTYGTEFTRESTRLKQQAALQDALRRLQSTLASSSADQLANASSTDGDVAKAALAAQQQAEQAQLKRLQSITPIGRIALELPLDARSIADLPDLPLENGDSVMVPSRPGFVFAVGAVANENALVWRAGRTVQEYLRSAGVEGAADEDNTFIVRADGSVVHARDYSNLFSNGFGAVNLMPGDTVVVPEKLDRTTKLTAFLRGAKDWTQILYQFGLGAAAFHTLKN